MSGSFGISWRVVVQTRPQTEGQGLTVMILRFLESLPCSEMENTSLKSVCGMHGSFLLLILEVVSARTPSDTDTEHSTTPLPTLSLYVTCLMLDYPNAEYEIAASMLAAIKCQDDRVGERGARADWAWDFWQTEWTFRQDNEVWRKLLLGCIFPFRISDSRRLQNVPCRHSLRCSRTQEFVKRTRS